MPRARLIFWFEPYWSHHAKPCDVVLDWPIPLKILKKTALTAIVTWLVASTVICLVFPDRINVALLAGAALAIMLVVSLSLILGYRYVLPKIHWFIPTCVSVHRRRIEITDLISGSVLIERTDLVQLVLDEGNPVRRTMTVRWKNGERRVGVPRSVDISALEEITRLKIDRC